MSVSAHLGGALAGFLFARYGMYLNASFRRGPRPVRRGSQPGASGNSGFLQTLDSWLGGSGKKSSPAGRHQVGEATIVSEIEESEVDRILDKINEHGYESLTDKEKRLLLEASRE